MKLLSLAYWERFIKFNAVGLTGAVVNEGLFALLTYFGLYYLYADAVAIEISIISNFVINDLWTFKDRRHGHILGRLTRFNALMLLGLAVNLAVVYVATDRLAINPLISNLLGIALSFLLRYFLSIRYAWVHIKDQKPKQQV